MARVFNFENREFDLISGFIHPDRIIDVDWSRTGDKNASPMHSIASYLAMFAPAMPEYFINELTNEGDLIYDPFSGRGTTALKSRELNRRFIGSDLNPYALVLSRAKVATASKQDVLGFVNEMENNYQEWQKNNKNFYRQKRFDELRYFYSPKVLKQLLYIRECYGENWNQFDDVRNVAFAFTLGLMHGQTRKNGTTMYFSLDMSNVISMSPNYVKNYSEAHNLIKPKLNVFQLIRDRIHSKYDEIISRPFDGNVSETNALMPNNAIDNNSVKLLITSPPYLSVVNYTSSNWLKLWLLGYDRNKLKDIKLSDKLNFENYIEFITQFLNNVYPKIQPNGYVALIVGDVHEKRLIEEVWARIQNDVQFNLVEIYWDEGYLQEKKATNMLNSKKGKATTIEKVLLLRK